MLSKIIWPKNVINQIFDRHKVFIEQHELIDHDSFYLTD
jgi:hypothetical protein